MTPSASYAPESDAEAQLQLPSALIRSRPQARIFAKRSGRPISRLLRRPGTQNRALLLAWLRRARRAGLVFPELALGTDIDLDQPHVIAPKLGQAPQHQLRIAFVELNAVLHTVLQNKPPVAIEVVAQPITAFDVRDPSHRQFGLLEFRGDLVLRSPFKQFGGISAIRVAADGAHFIALSDRGWWWRGRRNRSRERDGDGSLSPGDGQAVWRRGRRGFGRRNRGLWRRREPE